MGLCTKHIQEHRRACRVRCQVFCRKQQPELCGTERVVGTGDRGLVPGSGSALSEEPASDSLPLSSSSPPALGNEGGREGEKEEKRNDLLIKQKLKYDFSKTNRVRGAWVSQSVKPLPSALVVIPGS